MIIIFIWSQITILALNLTGLFRLIYSVLKLEIFQGEYKYCKILMLSLNVTWIEKIFSELSE
jgi:hypothetical protein